MQATEHTYYIDLYDLYGSLLTDKQREYFECYYFEDLSLGEIAEIFKLSRNAIFDQIKKVNEKLKVYEEKLGFLKKINLINSLEIEEEIKTRIIDILKEE